MDKQSIYFDNSATSYPKPDCVYDAINAYMRGNGASPGRGNYANAMASEKLVCETRKAVAKLLGAKKPSEIVFAANATEAINTVLKGYLRCGDEVLTSNVEHNAMWRPLKTLEKSRNVKVNCFNVTLDGKVDLTEIADKLTERTRLIAFVHGSNVLGNILPVADISKLARSKGMPVFIDASQTAGAYPINVVGNGIGFLAFTGHKGILGPTGTGGFNIRTGLQIDTLKEGGTGSMAKSPFPPELPPDRFEAGTMNIFGLAGLKAAVEYILWKGVFHILEHERRLMSRLVSGLAEIPGVEIYGSKNPNEKLGLVSFNIENRDPYEIASLLPLKRHAKRGRPEEAEAMGMKKKSSSDILIKVSQANIKTEEDVQNGQEQFSVSAGA